ncbi:HupE/UreJ family protein [Nocardioides sp.]|uniref:HupE/UreJ family protein n=1 Tax=Nocardioides sp. TaxID=35761 RepID=UPI00260E49B3|nr:HupE/UreJ family protein [Nocardioides sp.]
MSRLSAVLGTLALILISILALGGPAQAHGFTTAIYVQATSPAADHVQLEVALEYDLMLVTVADTEKDDAFYRQGQPAWEDADFPTMTSALTAHASSLRSYLQSRLTVAYGGTACTLGPLGGFSVAMNKEQSVPYASVRLDYTCPHDADADVLHQGHIVTSKVFGDDEGYVTGAKTIVTYDLDGTTGSAALDGSHSSFSTKQSWGQRFWEFYRLGIEHLLHGADHLLFLTALIIGSRRLREVVLAATTFTLAHSLTLVLAAFGVVHVRSSIVEPLIALSIAATAAWYLWRVARRGEHVTDLDTTSTSHVALDRAGWSRLGIVFCFGLVHGMGFAGALGIDHAWSWPLLWSLLVFNIGIETVQLCLIALIFPILVLLRRRSPRVALWLTSAIGVVVAVAGLVWFVQRVFGFTLLPG